jgi:glycosyltransferase involved in cell wall biosynthesis
VDAGRKVVLSGFLDFAVATAGAENVVLLCISSGPEEEASIGLAPCRTVFVPPAPAVLRAGAVLWNSFVLRRYSIQEMVLGAPAAIEALRTLLCEMKPDVIVVDTIRVARLVSAEERRTARCILHLDDLYSLRYRRILKITAQFPDAATTAVGTFARFLPGLARRLVHNRAVQSVLLRIESVLVARREAQMPDAFDEVLLFNAGEAAYLRDLTGAANVRVISPLISVRRVSGQLQRAFRGEPIFLFVGNLLYPANAYSLSLFLRRAMPALVEQVPDVRVMVVGRDADAGLVELTRTFGGRVELLGYIDNLEVLAATGTVVLLIFGTGSR